MIVIPKLPEGYTIFCDDIRYEIGEKHSFIGVYSNFLIVDGFPASISQIAACVTLRDEVSSDNHVNFRLYLELYDTGEDLLLEEQDGQFRPIPDSVRSPIDSPSQFQEIRWDVRVSPLNIPGPGRLKVRAYIDGDEYRLGSLTIECQQNLDEDAN
jgi:hypothetical protein